MNILFVAHGHINCSKGGAENAAFSMFYAFRQYHGFDVNILCAVPDHVSHSPGLNKISEYAPGEFLMGSNSDYFEHRNSHLLQLTMAIKDFLGKTRPDIVHIHHYVHFGIDIIPVIRSSCSARIAMTLHEYIPLCHRNGQMLKLSGELCSSSSPVECSKCFETEKSLSDPENYGNNHFFRRDFHFRSCLSFVDHFISPSHFLVNRYRQNDYNVPFSVIENGLPDALTQSNRSEYRGRFSPSRSQFGYFGQLNHFKGIIKLLETIKIISEDLRCKDFHLHIHGGSLEHQTEQFKESFYSLVADLRDSVTYHGAYKQADLPSLMARVDWVVVPSIWWENSPVIIQESLYFYRPVIASNLGGMSEKLEGKGGLLFDMSESFEPLASALKNCIGNVNAHSQLVDLIHDAAPVTSSRDCCNEHFKLYQALDTKHHQSD
jgi:glycosyltransferase involved in cell wall biosynthesis